MVDDEGFLSCSSTGEFLGEDEVEDLDTLEIEDDDDEDDDDEDEDEDEEEFEENLLPVDLDFELLDDLSVLSVLGFSVSLVWHER